MIDPRHITKFHVSPRTIRTTVSDMLCALIYPPIQRNSAFTCIMGGSMSKYKGYRYA